MKKHILPCFVIIVISTLLCTFATLYFLQGIPMQSDAGYISTIATLIGVMVTFAIGYQILSALDVKREIEVSQRRLDRTQRRNELESKRKEEQIKTLEESLRKEVYITTKRLELSAEIRTCYSIGLIGKSQGSYESALLNLMEGYIHRLDFIPFAHYESNITSYDVLGNDRFIFFHTPHLSSFLSEIVYIIRDLYLQQNFSLLKEAQSYNFFLLVKQHPNKASALTSTHNLKQLLKVVCDLGRVSQSTREDDPLYKEYEHLLSELLSLED